MHIYIAIYAYIATYIQTIYIYRHVNNLSYINIHIIIRSLYILHAYGTYYYIIINYGASKSEIFLLMTNSLSYMYILWHFNVILSINLVSLS